MSKLYAAFGEFEIPAPIGAITSGWMPPLRPVRFKTEPLLGNVAMLKNEEALLVLYSMDLLGLETEDCERIRREVAEAVSTDYACVSISCTHNHAGPNSMLCDTPKDPQLVEQLRQKMVQSAKELLPRLEPAVMGWGFTYESELSGNRRYVLKDGTVRTHPQLNKVEVLYAEGPIDPVVGVVCVRDMEGLALGYLVNFACHPLFYGGQGIASPNYPGELRKELKRLERPECVCLFLNGACGDICPGNPLKKEKLSNSDVGIRLAQRSYEVALGAQYTADVALGGKAGQVAISKRTFSPQQLERAERVVNGETELRIDSKWFPISTLPNTEFAQMILTLHEQVQKEPTSCQPLQTMRIGETVWAFCPGELFVKYGMALKVRSKERLTFVSTYSNGNVGYLFTPEAQESGGYEPTPVLYSHHDCTAGAAIVDGLCNLLETT